MLGPRLQWCAAPPRLRARAQGVAIQLHKFRRCRAEALRHQNNFSVTSEQLLEELPVLRELPPEPVERASPSDIASIAKQFGYTPKPAVQADMLAVPVGARCAHGFPQAFEYFPFGHKVSAGNCRLSCPLLTEAIDKLEAGGAIQVR